jgi:hypothetical protein
LSFGADDIVAETSEPVQRKSIIKHAATGPVLVVVSMISKPNGIKSILDSVACVA